MPDELFSYLNVAKIAVECVEGRCVGFERIGGAGILDDQGPIIQHHRVAGGRFDTDICDDTAKDQCVDITRGQHFCQV